MCKVSITLGARARARARVCVCVCVCDIRDIIPKIIYNFIRKMNRLKKNNDMQK